MSRPSAPVRLLSACVVAVSILTASLLAVPANAQPRDDRPPDGLLEREDLQAVVNAQVRRDGAALIERLDDSDPAVRARAAFALASVQDTAAIPALVGMLDDPTPDARADAAFALGQMPSGVSADSLLAALDREDDATVRRRLVEAVGKTGSAGTLPRLVSLDLPDRLAPDVALAVARYGMRDVLGPDAAPEATTAGLDWLVPRLTSADAATRRYAAYFFGRIGAEVWQSRADTLRGVLDGYERGDPAAMHVVRALGKLGNAADAARLQRWLEEAQDWRTRVNAARALAPIADAPGTREALRAALDDPTHVAVTAAQAVAGASWRAEDARAVANWLEAHPDRWRVAAPLLRGAARNDTRSDTLAAVSEAFILSQVDRWEGEAVPTAALLGALAPLDTAAALTRLDRARSADDPRVASAALSALADRWEQVREEASGEQVAAYFERFAAGVTRGDVATVNAAAPALADTLFRPRGAADTLAATYERLRAAGNTAKNVEALTALLDALGEATTPPSSRADAILNDALRSHPHPAIRQAAAGALTARTGDDVTAPPTDPPATRPVDWEALAGLGTSPRLVLQTDAGDVAAELDATQAPQTTATICGFAREGRYDGVPFHRVVANFVVQGGDFARRDGWGGPGFFIRSEFTRIPYTRGAIGMASAGKDTEGSQFFLTHSTQPHLDGRYTAFGTVARGLSAVDRLRENDVVESATCVPGGS